MNYWVFNADQLERALAVCENHPELGVDPEQVRRFFGSNVVWESNMTQWAPDPEDCDG